MNHRVIKRIIFVVISLSAYTGPASAQGLPDLSGTWKAVEAGTSGRLQPFDVDWYLRIEQDASQLVLVQDMIELELEHTFAYRLDGTESRNEASTVTGERWNHLATARFVDDTIVIDATTTTESGHSWGSRVTYSIDPDGRLRFTRTEPSLDAGIVTETIIWVKQ